MTFKYQLYASPGYLEQFGVPQSVEDLAHHRLLSFCEDKEKKHGAISHTVNWLLQVGNPLGKTHNSFFQTNTVQALLKAAQLNMGIATFAEESPCFAHSGLVKVLPDLKGPELDIYYVYPKELAHSKFITCFGDHLEKTIPQIYRTKKE